MTCTVVAPPSSVVECLWEVFVWCLGGCSCRVCVCRCRGCCSLSVCVCVCVWPVDLCTVPNGYPVGTFWRWLHSRPTCRSCARSTSPAPLSTPALTMCSSWARGESPTLALRYTYIYMSILYMCIHTYIYLYMNSLRRLRRRARHIPGESRLLWPGGIHTYIYIYIYI